MPNNTLDINTLEGWLWKAACKIRGEIDAPKYKEYILPLIFIKRLSDVFDDEVKKLAAEYGDMEAVEILLDEDPSLVRCYIPQEARWKRISILTTNVGEALTNAVRAISRLNPNLLGVIDMVQCTSAVVTTIDPVFSLLDMPYMFVNEEHHQKVLNGPIGKEWMDGLRKHNMQGLAFYSCGFRNMYTKDIKIQKPEDLDGLKIRVMESNVMIEAINYMGASATPLAASEVFQSLRTGVVDGAENDPVTFVSDKYYEAGCNNYSLTRHFANQHILVVNSRWFDMVKEKHPDLFEIIINAPRKVREEFNRQWREAENMAFEKMRSEEVAVTINEVRDVRPFIKNVQPVYDKFFKKNPNVPVEWVDRVRKEARL